MPIAVMVTTCVAPRVARADRGAPTKAECIDAYTSGQRSKQRGELAAARARLMVCSRDPCPTALQADCSEWLSEVQRLQPTVVIVAQDSEGHDRTDVRVIVDGAVVAERLDARAVEIDPGERTFRFELAGHAPVEQRILVREGQKAREISVKLVVRSAAGPARAPASAGGFGPPPPGEEAAPGPPWTAYAFGGLALAGLGTFAGFGLAGVSQRSDLLASCNDHCADDQKSSVDTKFLVADIALIVGAVAAVVATYVFIARPSSAPRSP
ncbi:MAG: hypothetical protein JWP87_4187 [Labilithrix sp.]|jgi:hypothetical protein|nr:hypothetical protein [Labilithrix sp.]